MNDQPYISQPLEVRATTLANLRAQGHEWKEIADMLGTSESVVYRDNRRARLTIDTEKSARRRDVIVRNAERGACYGSLMRGFTSVPQEDPMAALRALQLCQSCPIKALCVTIVDPMFFDGVCGGEAYHNGKVVTREVRRLAAKRIKLVQNERGQYEEVSLAVACWCGGTRYGRNRHMARSEKPCPWSARAHSQYESARKKAQPARDEYVLDWANVRSALKGGAPVLNKKEKVAVVVTLSLLEQDLSVIALHAAVTPKTVRKYRSLFNKGEVRFEYEEEAMLAELVQEFAPTFAPSGVG